MFDVETSNRLNNRMSAIGISIIENGCIADGFYSLVDPKSGFDYFNSRLTGISEETVVGAPTFPDLWTRISPIMSDGILVAHNAAFDMGVLRRCLYDYGIAWKESVPYLCTVQMGRRLLPGMSHKLDALCDYYGISLSHHQAESDARACAEILLRYLENGADVSRYIKSYSL